MAIAWRFFCTDVKEHNMESRRLADVPGHTANRKYVLRVHSLVNIASFYKISEK